MKRQILNLEGVAILTKQQQKAVNGGTLLSPIEDFQDKPKGRCGTCSKNSDCGENGVCSRGMPYCNDTVNWRCM